MKIISAGTSEPISLELARKQCKIDPDMDGTSYDDPLLEIYITAAREWVEAYLGMIIAPTTVQISLDAFPAAEIALESGPVIGPVSITYFDEEHAAQTLGDEVFELDTDPQVAVVRLRTDQVWPTTDGTTSNVSVQYSVGYSAEGDSPDDVPIPKSIKAAILMLVSHLNKNRDAAVEVALTEMPMGVKFLLSPLKLRKGFA